MSFNEETNAEADAHSREIPAGLHLPALFSEAEWRAYSRGNWFWLVDLPGRGSLVRMTYGPPTTDEILALRFESVRSVDLAISGVAPIPVDSETADCVLVHRPWVHAQLPNVTPLLSECARILRPGGHLVMALDQIAPFRGASIWRWLPRALVATPGAFLRRWSGRESREQYAPWPLRGLAHELHALGFAELRTYFVVPTIDAPQQMIPAHPAAIAVHEANQVHTGVRRVMRRALMAAALEAVLFPGYLLIAVR